MKPRTIGALTVCVAALVLPEVVYPVLLMKVLCYGLFASALNLLLGFGGLLSFGHAAFFGAGAYTAAYLTKHAGLTPEFGLLAAAGTAAVLGWMFGVLEIKRTGIHFAMITLALAQMVYFFLMHAPFTGGDDGLQGVPRGSVLGLLSLASDRAMYYFVLAVFALCFGLIYRVVDSPYGQILKAIRENEPRVRSLGYDTSRFKLIAMVVSSAIAGVAGGMQTMVFGFATLNDAHWHASGEVVLMTILGGIGTFFGPLVGATVVLMIQHELSERVGALLTAFTGLIFIACVLVFRRGIVGEIGARLAWRRAT